MKAIREYFRTGRTPAPGTVCEVENCMFGGGDGRQRSRELVGGRPEPARGDQEAERGLQSADDALVRTKC